MNKLTENDIYMINLILNQGHTLEDALMIYASDIHEGQENPQLVGSYSKKKSEYSKKELIKELMDNYSINREDAEKIYNNSKDEIYFL